jgi:hypothetical protein
MRAALSKSEHPLTGDPDRWGAAWTVTIQALREYEGSDASFCLCHGIAGNVEALRELSSAFLIEVDVDSVCRTAVLRGIEQYSASGLWPSGSGRPGHPSLMLGNAGVGWMLLRESKADIPNLLSPSSLSSHRPVAFTGMASQDEDR